MLNRDINWIAGFIWNIDDDVLRDVYMRGKYRDGIVPMTTIRCLQAVFESLKKATLQLRKQLADAGMVNKVSALCETSGNAFYNISPFTHHDLKSDFEALLDSFLPNVKEIIAKFKFNNQVTALVDADILGSFIEKITSNDVNLEPNQVLDSDPRGIPIRMQKSQGVTIDKRN